MTEHPKMHLVIAGAIAAALLGAMDVLAQLSSTRPDRRALVLLGLSWLAGVAFGGFAGYYFAEPLRDYLVRFGVRDAVAVAALLGLFGAPAALPIVRAFVRRATTKIEGGSL